MLIVVVLSDSLRQIRQRGVAVCDQVHVTRNAGRIRETSSLLHVDSGFATIQDEWNAIMHCVLVFRV